MITYEYLSQSPFTYQVLEKQKGTYMGRGMGHKLMAFQEEANSHYNNLRRSIRQDINPDFIVQRGALVDPETQEPPIDMHYRG
jgi:hypothetical protein